MRVARGAPVRIVSWNAQQGLPRKQGALEALGPDLAVLCEVHEADPWAGSLLTRPACWQADGPWPAKQVAVVGFGEGFRAVETVPGSGRFCAGIAGPAVGLLGIWSVPEPPVRYGQEVLRILEAHAEWISRGDVVVAGDFNIDAGGTGNGPGGRALFAEITRFAATLGLVSAYHAYTGEPFGAESAMTHFHRRDPAAGFHIDFCLIPASWAERLVQVRVGDPDEWLRLSDHMPLIVDLGPHR